jgi:hypothetical protein
VSVFIAYLPVRDPGYVSADQLAHAFSGLRSKPALNVAGYCWAEKRSDAETTDGAR